MTSNHEFTKSQWRRLRELGSLAYSRELAAELARLDGEFRRWRAGEATPFQLSDRIHHFHQGPSRLLFARYDEARVAFAVADAIRRGVLTEGDAGAEMMDLLRPRFEVLREIAEADRRQAPPPGTDSAGM